jgi:hypothetical protein
MNDRNRMYDAVNQQEQEAMNVETNGQDMNDPAVLGERVASMINTLIQVADPRLIVQALLGNAAELSALIVKAGKGTPANVAGAFSSALVAALTPAAEVKEEKRIEVVPAGVIDLSKRR